MRRKVTRIKKEFVEELESFQKELKKHFLTFITGSFSFVAALVWRDTIKSIIDKMLKSTWVLEKFPVKEAWFLQLLTAILVTIITAFGIYIATKFLRVNESNK